LRLNWPSSRRKSVSLCDFRGIAACVPVREFLVVDEDGIVAGRIASERQFFSPDHLRAEILRVMKTPEDVPDFFL